MPKTIRNKYDDAVSFNKLLEAHKKARKGKREKNNVIEFEFSKTRIFKGNQGVNFCGYKIN